MKNMALYGLAGFTAKVTLSRKAGESLDNLIFNPVMLTCADTASPSFIVKAAFSKTGYVDLSRVLL